MKKILMPFEGSSYHRELPEFGCALNILSPILLTAVFVPEVDYGQLWSATGGLADAVYVPDTEEDNAVIEDHSVSLVSFCRRHSIALKIRADQFDFALPAIRREARFADLLVVSAAHFFDVISTRQPNAFMKEILHSSECPIMLVPDNAGVPGEIVLLYDGSAASVFAIKQFAYLFPELASTQTSLVHIREKKGSDIPEREFIGELISQHFVNCRILDLHIRPEEFFDTWMADRDNPWLVSGSYGRSDLSQLFSGSFIAGMIRKHKVPVFIAHP